MKNLSKNLAAIAILVFLALACSQSNENRGNQNTSVNKPAAETPANTSKESSAAVPKPAGFVADVAGVLSAKDKTEIDNVLKEFKRRSKIEFAVALIDTTNGKSLDDYSLSLARDWGLGDENGGALLAIAIKDRAWHIQIDKNLEDDLSGDEMTQIGDAMKQDFRDDNYGSGLKKSVEKMIATLAEKHKFEPIKF